MDDDEFDGMRHRLRGWHTEGGKLRWFVDHSTVSDDAAGDDADQDSVDEAALAGDNPQLPSGTSESVRVRAALAWLERNENEARERIIEHSLTLHEERRARDATSTRRRQPAGPSAAEIELARQEAVAITYVDAANLLREQVDHAPGRALVEWYLALQMEDVPQEEPTEPLALARFQAHAEILRRIREHAERLAMPDIDDE